MVHFRHAGSEEPVPYLIRGHPGVFPTPYQVRGELQSGTILKTGSRFSPGTLDSGFRRNDAFLNNQMLFNIFYQFIHTRPGSFFSEANSPQKISLLPNQMDFPPVIFMAP